MLKGFRISDAATVHNKLADYAEQGALRGVYLGFPNLHKHYTMALPSVTDVTGFPRSGKTQFMLECLMNTSLFYGWKHLVFCPDIGTEEEIISDLIHIYTGLTFDKRFKNHIQEEQIADATPWVLEHFKVLVREDPKAKISPVQFWELAVQMKKEVGIKTAMIDSWKDMDHSDEKQHGRTDQYLEYVLGIRNAIAWQNKMHFITVVHPTRTDKDSSGNRKPPTPYDMKGGTEWFNNGKVIMTVHRDPKRPTITEIYFWKVKPRSIGEEGMIELGFDRKKLRYYFDDLGEKRFAEKEIYETKSDQVQGKAAPVQAALELGHIEEDNDEVPF